MIRQRCVSEAECLPIYAYDQRDATFVGYEAEATVPLFESPFANVSLTVFSDYVRARFKNDDVPRIPPLRYGAELSVGNYVWNTSLRYARSEAQSHSGAYETETSGYNLLNFTADFLWDESDLGELWVFTKATNLLNEDIR